LNEPRISFALVTRNRPASLERTLDSLRAQSAQPWEVVISDDSDETVTPRVCSLASLHGCRYMSGPRRGLYANRNLAALACRGTHVRTVDDDHEFPIGHVSACLEAVRADPAAVWVIGEHLPGEPAVVGSRCPPQLTPRGFSATPAQPRSMWAIADGASIYPSAIFARGLRFAEDFPFGAAYLEWGSRLHWLGYRIRHLDTTCVIHHYDPETRSYIDDGIDLSSRFFAMFAHSFLHQPTLRNRALTGGEVLRRIATRPSPGVGSLRAAWRAYRRHREPMIRDHVAHWSARTFPG
jgi:glycosyltransferase involved in cell wall biosynthesis